MTEKMNVHNDTAVVREKKAAIADVIRTMNPAQRKMVIDMLNAIVVQK